MSDSDNNVKLKVSTRWVHRKKTEANTVDGFSGDCNTVFEAMACFFRYCQCQGARPSLTAEEAQRGIKKRELDKLRNQNIEAKGCDVIELYEEDWWKMYKTDNIVG